MRNRVKGARIKMVSRHDVTARFHKIEERSRGKAKSGIDVTAAKLRRQFFAGECDAAKDPVVVFMCKRGGYKKDCEQMD